MLEGEKAHIYIRGYVSKWVSECVYIYVKRCRWWWWRQWKIYDGWGKKTNLGGRKVLLLLEARGRRQWKREGNEVSKNEFLQNWRYLSFKGTMFRVSISLSFYFFEIERDERERVLPSMDQCHYCFVLNLINQSWSQKYMRLALLIYIYRQFPSYIFLVTYIS